ncbi:MAG: hypothetical protein K2X47_08905 [Bdellovibrionales bacterium]|nr:hypothetical protein [Bdellovibrionales bacterium]
MSISLTQPRTELKEEHFENQRYQTREPSTFKRPKNVFRKPAAQPEGEADLRATTLVDSGSGPEVPVPGDTPPPEGFSGMLLGGNLDQVRDFRKSLDDRDLRKNWLELSFAPRWVNSHTSSSYWARDTQSKLLGFFVEGKFWVSPLFGIVADYAGTLSGTVQRQYGSDESAALKQNWLGAGVRFRRFFGSYKKMSTFAWGFDARQREQTIATEVTDKLSTRSRALFLTAESRIPISARWAMTVQVSLAPWVDHVESGGLNGESSGTGATSTAYNLGLGFEYLFDRGNRLFFRTKGDIEANQFQGGSALVDPRTGQSAKGLAVSQSYIMFELGYTWGQ